MVGIAVMLRDRYAQCVTLCFFGLVIDMPVVVHVKVVVYPVMAQWPFPLDHRDSSFAVH